MLQQKSHLKYTCVWGKTGEKYSVKESCTKGTNTLEICGWFLRDLDRTRMSRFTILNFFLIKNTVSLKQSQTNTEMCDTDNENPL